MARDFTSFLGERIVLFDGATGTRLYDMGVFLNRCFDELNLSSPGMVEEVHRGYAAAGVDVLETNTFGANRVKLERHGFGDQVAAINRAGAVLARTAAGEDVFVAGAVGPLGIRIEPWGPTSVEEAAQIFAEQAAALAEGGVDLFSVETFYDLAEVEAAVSGIRQVSDLPIVVQMTLEDDGSSLEGVAPEVFGPRLAALPVTAVGVNCSVGPGAMLDAVERLVEVVTLPVAAQPNAQAPVRRQPEPLPVQPGIHGRLRGTLHSGRREDRRRMLRHDTRASQGDAPRRAAIPAGSRDVISTLNFRRSLACFLAIGAQILDCR